MKKLFRSIKNIIRILRKENVFLEHFAIGMNSHISKGEPFEKHILMLDYDIDDLDFVEKDLTQLIDFFNLSCCDIWKTNQGYHVFFWYDNDLPYSRVRMMIDFSRCDNMYKYISVYYDYKTIRVAGKYKELDTRFIKVFGGKRQGTSKELSIGFLKRQEYLSLRGQHKILDKDKLKEAKDEKKVL